MVSLHDVHGSRQPRVPLKLRRRCVVFGVYESGFAGVDFPIDKLHFCVHDAGLDKAFCVHGDIYVDCWF